MVPRELSSKNKGLVMMTELWWKVFLAAIATTGLAKLFGCPFNMVFLFAVSFIGWAIGLILIISISGFLWERRKKNKEGGGKIG